jgi:hypothetical protein
VFERLAEREVAEAEMSQEHLGGGAARDGGVRRENTFDRTVLDRHMRQGVRPSSANVRPF